MSSESDNAFWGASSNDPQEMESARRRHISRTVWTTFKSLDNENSGFISSHQFIGDLSASGLHIQTDPRLSETLAKLKEHKAFHRDQKLSLDQFADITHENITLIRKGVTGDLVVPDFDEFCKKLLIAFDEVKENRSGNVAAYIPELKSVDPDLFSVSVCTIDGQTWSHGDTQSAFSVQSCAKPVSYMMAVQEKGLDYVHGYVGREPSGQPFNSLTLKSIDPALHPQGAIAMPHNPSINAGAIMICALLMEMQSSMSARFKSLLNVYKRLFGELKPEFSNSTYLSEKENADRNWCLAYMMQDANAFPPDTNLKQTLEFYLQTCSIEATTPKMAILASSLANGGVCPFTSDRVFRSQTVRNCLSLMLSTGMYDYSGEWQFSVGVPAKSGVSGVVFMVIPNVLGIAIYSPRLDKNGNSARAVQFAQLLGQRIKFHMFDSVTSDASDGSGPSESPSTSLLVDLREKKTDAQNAKVVSILFAAASGDIKEIQRLIGKGSTMACVDYDSRSALHLSAAEGAIDCVKYVATSTSDIYPLGLSPMDRWGRTPLDEALMGNHGDTASYLASLGAKTGDLIRQGLSATASVDQQARVESQSAAVDATTSQDPESNNSLTLNSFVGSDEPAHLLELMTPLPSPISSASTSSINSYDSLAIHDDQCTPPPSYVTDDGVPFVEVLGEQNFDQEVRKVFGSNAFRLDSQNGPIHVPSQSTGGLSPSPDQNATFNGDDCRES